MEPLDARHITLRADRVRAVLDALRAGNDQAPVLVGADFTGAQFIGAVDFSSVQFSGPVNFYRAQFSDAPFRRTR